MTMSEREFWTVLHGLVFGTVFLLAFAGGFAGLWSLQPALTTSAGIRERMKRLLIGMWTMAVIAWLTVFSGTYVVYPWYRDPNPSSPRSFLLSNPDTSAWHTFGMEWKEHVGWFAPILATAAAFIVTYYGMALAERNRLQGGAGSVYHWVCGLCGGGVVRRIYQQGSSYSMIQEEGV